MSSLSLLQAPLTLWLLCVRPPVLSSTFCFLGSKQSFFLFTCLTLTCHSGLSSDGPSEKLSLTSQDGPHTSPGLPQIPKHPSSELRSLSLSFPLTAPNPGLLPSEHSSIYPNRVWAPWDRVWAFFSHCCVPDRVGARPTPCPHQDSLTQGSETTSVTRGRALSF